MVQQKNFVQFFRNSRVQLGVALFFETEFVMRLIRSNGNSCPKRLIPFGKKLAKFDLA